jgi:5-methylcytosine-specific restriction endonuclease McrA
VLAHDTSAFVEQIAVPKPDRRAEKLRRQAASAELEAAHVSVELRLAEEALKRLEERNGDERDAPHGLGRLRHTSHAEREADARRMVAELRDRLGAERERARELDQRAREHEARRQLNVSYRLHSEQHHTTYSEPRFMRMSQSQRTRPVLVTTRGSLSWWWYLDRFWWDDERRDASEVRAFVLERDAQTMRHGEAAERTRAVAVGDLPPALAGPDGAVPDSVRTAVWRRDGGRCVDCGADGDLVFDVIIPASRGGSLNTPNIELRCQSCLAIVERRERRGGRGKPPQRGEPLALDRLGLPGSGTPPDRPIS